MSNMTNSKRRNVKMRKLRPMKKPTLQSELLAHEEVSKVKKKPLPPNLKYEPHHRRKKYGDKPHVGSQRICYKNIRKIGFGVYTL